MQFRTKQRTNYIKFLLKTFINEKLPVIFKSESGSTDLQIPSFVKLSGHSGSCHPKSSLNFKLLAPVKSKNHLAYINTINRINHCLFIVLSVLK